MAITKTKFINYVRCPRYVALDKIRNKLLDDVSLEEYKEEEKYDLLSEIISGMEDESNGILNDDDPKLETHFTDGGFYLLNRKVEKTNKPLIYLVLLIALILFIVLFSY